MTVVDALMKDLLPTESEFGSRAADGEQLTAEFYNWWKSRSSQNRA